VENDVASGVPSDVEGGILPPGLAGNKPLLKETSVIALNINSIESELRQGVAGN